MRDPMEPILPTLLAARVADPNRYESAVSEMVGGVLVPWGYRTDLVGQDPAEVPILRCPICGDVYIPFAHSTSVNLMFGRGVKLLCQGCLFEARTGYLPVERDRARIVPAVQLIHEITGSIPRSSSTWRQHLVDQPMLDQLDDDFLIALVAAAIQLTEAKEVKAVFGSWHALLVASGIFADGTERTSRGTRSIAVDGHLCLSIGERLIDDWLHQNGLDHEREPPYPGTNYRADFQVGKKYIEYFGLAGQQEYEDRRALKETAASAAGMRIIGVFPSDIDCWASFKHSLLPDLAP